jgi:hypothetical protein
MRKTIGTWSETRSAKSATERSRRTIAASFSRYDRASICTNLGAVHDPVDERADAAGSLEDCVHSEKTLLVVSTVDFCS